MRKKVARSCSDGCANRGIGRRRAGEWEAKYMIQYQFSSFRAYEEAGVIGCMSDAARIGDPPENREYPRGWIFQRSISNSRLRV